MSNSENQPQMPPPASAYASPQPSKRWPLRLLLYLAGLIVSGFVGVWIKAQTEKSAINIQITSITARAPNTEQLMSDKVGAALRGGTTSPRVPVDPQLKKLTADHSWLPSPKEESRSDYLESLLDIQDKASTVVQGMRLLRQQFGEWPSSYEGAQLEIVYRTMREHSELIFAHLYGETRRGAAIFSGPKPKVENLEMRFIIETDDDGDFFVNRGKLRLPIVWSTQGKGMTASGKARLKEVAERVANAVGYGIASDLQQVKKAIEKLFEEEGSTMEVISIVERELQLNSNWHVTATVANNGKDTIALDPRSMLYLQTKGRRYLDANQREQKLDANYRVGLAAVNEGKRQLTVESASLELSSIRPTSSPILVRGGEAVAVTFESMEFIGRDPEGTRLLSLFKSEGCPCLLAVMPLTQSKLDLKKRGPKLSSEETFREVKFDTMFADDLSVWPGRK